MDHEKLDDSGELLLALRDPRDGIPWFAIGRFGRMLAGLSGLEQLRIISEWALAPSRAQRLAVACALQRVTLASAETALKVLVDDDDAMVRAVARRSRTLRARRAPARPS
jgi:hypothetical protein